jgi:hypothetical protein
MAISRHTICNACWVKQYGDKVAIALKPHLRDEETCCYCGERHKSGIYIRDYDDQTLCKGNH